MNSSLLLRSLAALLLLATLVTPTPGRFDDDAQVILIVDRAVGEHAASIRERVAMGAGSAADVIVAPSVADTNESLSDALRAIRPGQQSAVVVASPGHWTGDESAVLRAAADAEIAVIWLPVPKQTSVSRVEGIRTADTAFPGQFIGVTVAVSLGETNAAEIVLLSDDGLLASAAARKSGDVHLQIQVPASGPLIIDTEIRDIESGLVIDQQKQVGIVNVLDAASVLVVSRSASAYAASLRNGGWAVRETNASQFSALADELNQFSVLVLDDVAVGDLQPGHWTDIDAAVRRNALGLLVLGGPHSFSLGAYRDSQLEELLPVRSEPPAREASASLVFLIDVSGSMGQPGVSATPLQIARQAVLETAQALRPVDRVGLMSFDVAGRDLLPLGPRPDHARSLAQVWPDQPGGGTQLIESLQQAIQTLQRDSGKQKILVLVTDGNLSATDIDSMAGELAGSDVELITMLIGDDAQDLNEELSQVVNSVAGRLVRVDDVLRLPSLMRQEIEATRPAIVSGPVVPTAVSPAAWLPGISAWPPVEQYLLTSAAEDADVNLVSEQGDVLIASRTAGAGRVVAVTFGFSEWANAWLTWRDWPTMAADLANFLAVRDVRAVRPAVAAISETAARLTVELADRSLRPVAATLLSPSAQATKIELEPTGPVRLGATLSLRELGTYTLVIGDDLSSNRYQFVNRPNSGDGRNGIPIAEEYVRDGLLLQWHSGVLEGFGNTNMQAWLASLALVLFLASLVSAARPRLRWRH